MEPIIGIDLGTTNSEVACSVNGKMEVLTDEDNAILPSCVGLSKDDKIIVGEKALNQAIIAPEKTVLSIKRLMGDDTEVTLGNQTFSPQEISAFILKALKSRAEKVLQERVNKAVITVPAYFTDAQRKATREAGEIAGLEVTRIINEPTAAALAYECDNPESRRILVYDLGGGTFDVSIVKIESGVVEVLSSTGDNRLGGDDFDQKLIEYFADHLRETHKVDVRENQMAMSRLKRTAENLKKRLSTEVFVQVEEDHIVQNKKGAVHLSVEVQRLEFEKMIEPDLVRTMESVNRAMKDAQLMPSDIDKIILVGGSTRIPKISEMLEEKFNLSPHQEIDPDLCVAFGAGIQAAREMGINDHTILVDVTPYTFGTSAIAMQEDGLNVGTFVPLIKRNTKLPARKSEVFGTIVDNQEAVNVEIYQGENKNAEENILLGNYMFYLSKAPAGSPITLNFDLDLNGILKIKAVEKHTGKHIDAVIENATAQFSDEELSNTRDRIDTFYTEDKVTLIESGKKHRRKLPHEFSDLIKRAEEKLEKATNDDREEIVNLIEDIQKCFDGNQLEEAKKYYEELDDILFYIQE